MSQRKSQSELQFFFLSENVFCFPLDLSYTLYRVTIAVTVELWGESHTES